MNDKSKLTASEIFFFIFFSLSPVLRCVRARIVHPHDDKDVLELGLEVGDEREGARLLELVAIS